MSLIFVHAPEGVCADMRAETFATAFAYWKGTFHRGEI